MVVSSKFEKPTPLPSADPPPASVPVDILQSDRALRILAVEGDPQARAILEAILTPLGHEMEIAATKTAALEACHKRVFDLILLAVDQPDLEGLAACSAIRAAGGANRDIPIIALTAFSPQGLLERAGEAGFDAVLAKPSENGPLIRTMRLLLRPRSIDAAEIEDVQDYEYCDEATDQPKCHSHSPSRPQRSLR